MTAKPPRDRLRSARELSESSKKRAGWLGVRLRREAPYIAVGLLVVGTLVVLDAVDTFGPPDDHRAGVFMPTLNGVPKVTEEEAAQYRAVLLRHVKRSWPVAPLFRSTVLEVDLSTLRLTPASVVADIGCGTGAFELALLEREVSFEKVYAVDIDRRSLDFLDFALGVVKLEGRDRINTVQSPLDDVRLPAGSVDVVFIHNTRFGMRHIDAPLSGEKLSQRDRAMGSLKRAMKPGARVFIYEPTRELGGKRRLFPREFVSEPFLAHGFKLLRQETISLAGEQMYYVVLELGR